MVDEDPYAIPPTMAVGNPSVNAVLMECLESIRPEGMSNNRWRQLAGLSKSYIDNLAEGAEPNVYMLERLVTAVGCHMSDFWRMVEDKRP